MSRRLHVAAHLDKTRDTLNHYDTAVIRKHALGRFSDMLGAMIMHPAMILYLDNQNNTRNGGNQPGNWARLKTIGKRAATGAPI